MPFWTKQTQIELFIFSTCPTSLSKILSMELNPDFYISRSEMAEEYYERHALEQMELEQEFLTMRLTLRAEEELQALQADTIVID